MKAWLLDAMTGIESLRLADIPDPTAGDGEAILRVQLAGLNPADRYMAQGEYPGKPAMPHILGRDGLGVIESIGPGVTDFKPGDRAIVLRSEIGVNKPGTFAEKVAVKVESLAPVPAGWTDEQAAGAPLVYLTAHQALDQWGPLPKSNVLVTGASGGVGVATVQLASAMGHAVIALSRSESKRQKLSELGATLCLDSSAPDWPDQLKKSLGKQRIDLAIDNIGGPDFSKLISVLGHNSKVSIVGRLAGPVPDFNTSSLLFRRIKIGGVAVGDYTAGESQEVWKKVVEALTIVNRFPISDEVFPFRHIAQAFRRLEQGPMGKVLLSMSGG